MSHYLCFSISLLLLQSALLLPNVLGIEEQRLSDMDDIIKVKNVEQTMEVQSNTTSAGTVYMDNYHTPQPIQDMKPFLPIMKGIGEQYQSVIIDCLPLVYDFPPGYDDNIYFHLPEIAAKLNSDHQNQSPLFVWIHPHLHVPHLDLKLKNHEYLSVKPIDLALYMADKANSIYPGTVPGILIQASPLTIDSYRKEIPGFKKLLTERGLKLGLLLDGYQTCETLPKKLKPVDELFSHFDYFYYHQRGILKDEDKTGSALQDAVLEARAFYGFYKTCQEVFEKYLPEGKNIKPVRGYLRAKFIKDEFQSVKFRFDVVRI